MVIIAFLLPPKLISTLFLARTELAAVYYDLANDIDMRFVMFQEEFVRLCAQLELLRDKNLRHGNRRLLCKIAAIQRAISEVDECSVEEETSGADIIEEESARNLNNVLAAVTDKIVCATMSPSEPEEPTVVCEEKEIDLDMSVESSSLNRNLRPGNNIVINLDDKTHFTNEISV